MQKDLTVGVLNEIYGKFLTARQSEIVLRLRFVFAGNIRKSRDIAPGCA